MRQFNLSEWGLHHRQLVLFWMLVLTLTGLYAYTHLGQSEDPPFTFKVMVVRAEWPGASALEMAEQVTDRIETKLQEIAELDYVRSYSKPGEAMVFVLAKDHLPSGAMDDLWYQVRKKIGDIRHTFPEGVVGPVFNDEFGDTYGNLFALVGEGYDQAELKRYALAIRAELLRVPNVAKVSFFGEQTQKIFVELSNTRMAALGLSAQDIARALEAENAVRGSGFFETANERIWLRPLSSLADVDAVGDLVLRVREQSFRLRDIAELKTGYSDPPEQRLRYMGQPAFGIGVSMYEGGDIIRLGKDLDHAVERIIAQLPAGLTLERVADQPEAVRESVNDFVKVLAEAVVIVMIVSLLSLGLRTGVVVLIIIPVVLAITFLLMYLFDIGLHKISLGALIIALGLLVDDAIIAVEMMSAKMEQGWERMRAASFAYVSTAMPMLSGTLVTAAGFLPIALAASSTGEYTRSIFQVTVIALLVSWVAAVLFVPYLGYYLLPNRHGVPVKTSRWQRWKARRGQNGVERTEAEVVSPPAAVTDPAQHEHTVYHSAFYTRLRAWVDWCVRHRWVVIIATLVVFVASLAVFARYVPQQFFPDSTRPELLVDVRLAEGVSHHAVDRAVKQVERFLQGQPGIRNYVAWVGGGSPRFYLPLDQQLPQINFAQFVILSEGMEAREQLRSALLEWFQTQPTEWLMVVNRLETGPPVGFPVQYRISGPDIDEVRNWAHQVAEILRSHAQLSNVHLDWDEPSKVVRLQVDPEKARLLGMSAADVATLLDSTLQGAVVTRVRRGTEAIDVVLRGGNDERHMLSQLENLAIPLGDGRNVPLAQLAQLEYGFEPGVIWRRDRIPTITVRGTLYGKIQPAVVVSDLAPQIGALQASLPLGYRLEVGGSVEESARGEASVVAAMPVFVLTVLTILMMQLQRFSLVFMVVLTAPLGMIGVTLALLLFRQPFGFVAMLGTIALSGMIMRNSVILVDQIRQDLEAGRSVWAAIVESTVRRFRPIVLTAAAAILAMIPLSRSAFFGPMAVAIMGGLTVATVLTLVFLPALYAAWFRVRPDTAGDA